MHLLKIVFLHLKEILNFQKCCKYNSGRLYFGEQCEHTLLLLHHSGSFSAYVL